jgi:hypothetical protein
MSKALKQLHERYHRIIGSLDTVDEPVRREIAGMRPQIESRLAELETACEPGGHEQHPLSRAPYLVSDLLFMLDRCEVVLEHAADLRPVTGPQAPRYPSLWQSIFRRGISLIIRLRAYMLNYEVRYPVPRFVDAMYPHAPTGVSWFLRRLVLRTRRQQ